MKRFDVFLVKLGMTEGHEIRKTRPCVVISPNVMNKKLGTVILAPMTTQSKGFPYRVETTFRKKKCFLVLDQIRSVDKKRLVRKLGSLSSAAREKTAENLVSMFSY